MQEIESQGQSIDGLVIRDIPQNHLIGTLPEVEQQDRHVDYFSG